MKSRRAAESLQLLPSNHSRCAQLLRRFLLHIQSRMWLHDGLHIFCTCPLMSSTFWQEIMNLRWTLVWTLRTICSSVVLCGLHWSVCVCWSAVTVLTDVILLWSCRVIVSRALSFSLVVCIDFNDSLCLSRPCRLSSRSLFLCLPYSRRHFLLLPFLPNLFISTSSSSAFDHIFLCSDELLRTFFSKCSSCTRHGLNVKLHYSFMH